MDKYEYIVNLAEKTAKRVSQNRESWMKFLTSAARIYKYPFKEQLLIYAQNPDATACASIEIWNKRMNCWVNKGSSGIALPDDTATYGHKLKYVFDVSNVHAVKPNGRYPKAWKLREEHKSDVLHRLEQIYGSTDSTKPFEERIIEISDQLAADAYTELQIDYPDLQDRIGFDKLSEQDFALCLKKLISESVSFTILSACGIEISDHEFSFDYINQFVSIKTLSVLGTKINDSARGVLAEIGKTVRIYDKLREKEQEKEISKKELANAPQPRYNALKRESFQEGNSKDKDNIEGGKQNGPGIRTDGRLSDSETESKSGTGGNGNEIRTSEGQISEGEIRWGENSNVSGRNVESTSSRDSGTGKREDGSPDIPDGGERRSKRTAQSTGSDALGEEDEQHPEPGGGSRTERTDLQPTNFVKPEESYTQLSLFPSAEEQRGSITAAEASKKYTMPAAFYLPETDLEVIIRSGGGQKDSRKRIYAKYTEGKSTDEIIAFLKKEYSQVGKGFELHGHPISVWFDENGMTAGYGMRAAESVVTTLSWDQIEKYIHAMITYGLYMDANEAALVDKTEMERVSYQIGYFLRDWIDDVPEELNSIEKIETLLSTHEGREQLESFLEDVDARISYGELKPKTVKSPGYLLSEIADLDRERIHFPLHDTVDVRQEDFITQDEIDYALCIGSGFADGKFRIYEYFMDLHNQKENADFLKKEYGIGGQSGALPGNSSSNSEHDAKGILLEKGSLLNPYTKVLLNWNVVEERICELIYADKYFSPQEKEEYNEINLEKASGMPDEEIKNGIKLPLATMQQRRETWGSQSKLDVQEPMIFILQSTVEKLSVGDKIPLSDADSFLIHQESGVLNYELHYLMNGTPQEYNAWNCWSIEHRNKHKLDGRQCYHFIISFAPGETDAITCFNIAQDFCEKYLAGKYEYVFSVHTDHAHMHAHIVFNSVSLVDGVKYHYSDGQWKSNIQPITDQLCEKYGLKKLTYVPGKRKGVDYGTWREKKDPSGSQRLREAIDMAIAQSDSYDDFLSIMRKSYQVKIGFSQKWNSEYLSFKDFKTPAGRYRRNYVLGKSYTVASIQKRISLNKMEIPESLKRLPPHIRGFESSIGSGFRSANGLYLTQHQKRYMIQYWRLKNSERTVTSGTGNIREYSKEADRNLRDLQTVQDNKIRTVQDLSSRLDELNQMTDSIRRELRAIQSSREDSETENVISEYLSIQSAFANAAVPIEMEGKFENRLDEIEENYPIEELIHQKESNSKKEKQLQKEIKNLQQASRRLSKLKKIQKR